MNMQPRDTQGRRRQDEILERQADSLLSRSLREIGPSDHPFHSLRWEERATTRDASVRDAYEMAASPASRERNMSIAQMLSVRLNLKAEDRVILAYLARGDKPQQVRAALGLTPNAVRNLMRRLRRMVAQAGLTPRDCRPRESEIEAAFRSECNRRAYRDERHCADGEELCKRYGKCVRRWYLRLPGA
jgi:DNA-binding CsgD family transcriptional regulator